MMQKNVKINLTVELEVPSNTTVEELVSYTELKMLPVNFWGETKDGKVNWVALSVESIREDVKHQLDLNI